MAEILKDKLVQSGICKMVVTMGDKGAAYASNNGEYGYIDAMKVSVVDTTGAGDSFCSGFISGMVKGLSFEECGRFANAVGAHCVMAKGATTGIKSFEEINAFIESRK